jgi:hypothetical protein
MRLRVIKVVAWPRMAHREKGHRRPNTKPRRRLRSTSPDYQRSSSASPGPKDVSAASLDRCERGPALPDPEGTGPALPDTKGELRFIRTRGNGFGRTRRRDMGPTSDSLTGFLKEFLKSSQNRSKHRRMTLNREDRVGLVQRLQMRCQISESQSKP